MIPDIEYGGWEWYFNEDLKTGYQWFEVNSRWFEFKANENLELMWYNVKFNKWWFYDGDGSGANIKIKQLYKEFLNDKVDDILLENTID